MTNNLKNSARYVAVRDLNRIEKENSYSNKIVDQTLAANQLSAKDVNLYTNLVYGTIQNKLTLDYFLAPFIKDPQKVDLWVRQLLRISVYQMQYLDRIPEHAIFNEAIEIAKQMGHEGTRRFVTGILHAIGRQGLPAVSDIKDPVEHLSIYSSTPRWLVEALIAELGMDKASSLLEAGLQTPAQSVRVNQLRSDTHQVISLLQELDFDVQDSRVSPNALRVSGSFIPHSPVYQSGKITIQDESAILSVESMELKPDDQVLDACAAPGGKTTQIAEYLTGSGHVEALDIHQNKLRLIQANADRMRVGDKITLQALDARKSSTLYADESFDQVLVDAPCSGLGLLRRKPEIKYEKSLGDTENLAKIQLAILKATAPLVKAGGRLTYSTCTILNTENQAVIDQFLADEPDFVQVKTTTKFGIKDDRETKSLTIYPDDFGSDGFFIATLVKQK
ncbi:ribosomal RNA small subunit methyltransferase B [Ligilactobacillus pabuli]|uniref:16S rRNA (cytosine(967)-C(5))-methyltransferase n=1 Tax=Ligilactobacillus pabuli TaxID=2886039 RepID=A0ABQ5JII0_9LACO|nr:16S rRNA (cytosine(967)-C(5))-methyltransferase RsmB [Ligilactobacillus pabuli]GKS80905.1 ribosomal RNA small subunit methyltransferase B [Ligilactobacillus pabuli]HIW88756.1 16S rRNA (cytosine(967)-C(5))-methyltransferase RsmB [Candidatus Ligilactobacillus excrementipullorum]